MNARITKTDGFVTIPIHNLRGQESLIDNVRKAGGRTVGERLHFPDHYLGELGRGLMIRIVELYIDLDLDVMKIKLTYNKRKKSYHQSNCIASACEAILAATKLLKRDVSHNETTD